MALELRTGEDFSVNGHMRGTVKLYKDDGTFLGPQWRGDLGAPAHLKFVTKELVAALEIFDPENANETYAKMLIWAVSQSAAKLAGTAQTAPAVFRPAADAEMETINVSHLDRLAQIAKGWASIKAANRPAPRYFRYGWQIADVTNNRVRVLNEPALTGVLLRTARWVKGAAQGHEVTTDPPEPVVKDIMHYEPADLPELRGVKEAPFCRPDGSFVTEPGYDPDSGFILAEHGLKIEVPDDPNDADIELARFALMEELLGDFPFVSDADKAGVIAAMLTPVVLPLIDGPTPLFMATAPTPRSGKGKLATVISIVSTGSWPPPQAQPRSDESWRKIITAKLKAGVPVVLIDNISSRIDSPALAALLTAPKRLWSDREMGTSRDLVLPNDALWLATANNPEAHDEITGRVIEMGLDPKVERPELRTDIREPELEKWAYANRGPLLSALLTFVRAWVRQGRPSGNETFGGFEGWARVIGGILASAGIPGLLHNRERFREKAASELDEIRPFIAIWAHQYPDKDVSVERLLVMCSAEDVNLLPGIRAGLRVEQARSALGKFLVSIQGRVFNVEQRRYRIVRGGRTETRRPGWRLEVVE